jgi:hypothetical protein
MIQLPGGGAQPGMGRAQLLQSAMQGIRSVGGMGRDNMVQKVPMTNQIGRSNAVSKAAANAAQMLLTRAVTKQSIQGAPQQISEHGLGQNSIMAPAQVSEHGAGQNTDLPGSGASNFAIQRLHQLVQAGLLGGMPQHMSDPADVWRKLSATLGSNPDALQRFLAVIHGHGQPTPNQGTGPYIGTM